MTSTGFRPSYKTCFEVSQICPVAATTYGYIPDLGANVFFTVWFGILLIASVVLGVRTKTWSYTAFLDVGLLGETLGYVGRLVMNSNVWNSSAYQLQICCLVLAPSFVAGSIYLTVKHLVLYCGPQYSRLKARLYPWIFVGCDLGSILLQAAGGGIAASAGKQSSLKLLNAGNALIVTGIAFQVATMAVCGLLVVDFVIRFRRARKSEATTAIEKPNITPFERDQDDARKMRNFKIFSLAIVVAYFTVLIRCIYRLPEMAGGWGNPLMRRENEFLLLDGMMIAIATTAMTVAHPGIFFPLMRKFATKTETDKANKRPWYSLKRKTSAGSSTEA